MWFKHAIDILFSIGLFINAILFLPQAIRLYQQKDSKDVSLITFGGFNFVILSAILYGYFHRDYILLFGYLISFITCGMVTCLVLKYRKRA